MKVPGASLLLGVLFSSSQAVIYYPTVNIGRWLRGSCLQSYHPELTSRQIRSRIAVVCAEVSTFISPLWTIYYTIVQTLKAQMRQKSAMLIEEVVPSRKRGTVERCIYSPAAAEKVCVLTIVINLSCTDFPSDLHSLINGWFKSKLLLPW